MVRVLKNRKSKSVYVKSADRTLDIFELLAEYPQGLTLSDMGKRLGIPNSSLHNLVYTMEERGYLLHNHGNHAFQLGPRLAQLNIVYQANINLIMLADKYMEDLRQITGETTSLVVQQGPKIVFIHKCLGEGMLQVINPVGTRLYTHSTGSGKVILAYLPDEEIDRLYPEEQLPTFTPNTIKSKTALRRELINVRRLGYAYDNQESENGVWAVASCIKNHDGAPIAALSIVAPEARIISKDRTSWCHLVKDAASKISLQLGYKETF